MKKLLSTLIAGTLLVCVSGQLHAMGAAVGAVKAAVTAAKVGVKAASIGSKLAKGAATIGKAFSKVAKGIGSIAKGTGKFATKTASKFAKAVKGTTRVTKFADEAAGAAKTVTKGVQTASKVGTAATKVTTTTGKVTRLGRLGSKFGKVKTGLAKFGKAAGNKLNTALGIFMVLAPISAIVVPLATGQSGDSELVEGEGPPLDKQGCPKDQDGRVMRVDIGQGEQALSIGQLGCKISKMELEDLKKDLMPDLITQGKFFRMQPKDDAMLSFVAISEGETPYPIPSPHLDLFALEDFFFDPTDQAFGFKRTDGQEGGGELPGLKRIYCFTNENGLLIGDPQCKHAQITSITPQELFGQKDQSAPDDAADEQQQACESLGGLCAPFDGSSGIVCTTDDGFFPVHECCSEQFTQPLPELDGVCPEGFGCVPPESFCPADADCCTHPTHKASEGKLQQEAVPTDQMYAQPTETPHAPAPPQPYASCGQLGGVCIPPDGTGGTVCATESGFFPTHECCSQQYTTPVQPVQGACEGESVCVPRASFCAPDSDCCAQKSWGGGNWW